MNAIEELRRKPHLIGLMIIAAIIIAWATFQNLQTQSILFGGAFIAPLIAELIVFAGPIGAFLLVLLLFSPGSFFALLGILLILILAAIALFSGNFTLFLVVLGFGLLVFLLSGGRKK